jgi:plasmid replication initiation protein
MTEPQPMLPFPPQFVIKSTPLCRARWAADSVLEARIIAHIASRVNPDDSDALTFDIPASALLGENYGGANLADLRAAAKKLVKRTVSLENEKMWAEIPLVSKCVYEKETGVFRTTIDPDIKPHFVWFKENVLKFTKYNLIEFMAMPSVYSQRIFELLQSWRDQPEFTRPLDELHEMLNTPKSCRKNFNELRKRVLEPAQKHIHFHTSVRFAWEPIKDGRKVTAIRFIFSGRRVAESKLEAARIAGGKVAAKSKKDRAARLEAFFCAKERKGICTLRDRAKLVCAMCDEHNVLQGFREQETQSSQ